MKKYYEITIRTLDDQRISFTVESPNLLNLLESMKGHVLTFIPNIQPDNGAFTIYAQFIKTIEYRALTIASFEKIKTYVITSHG